MKRSNGSQPPARANRLCRPGPARRLVTLRCFCGHPGHCPRMSDSPRTRTVLVTGAARGSAARSRWSWRRSGWHVAVHYRRSAEEAARPWRTAASCRPPARWSSLSRPTSPTKPQAARCCRAVVAALRRRSMRWSTTPRSSSTTTSRASATKPLAAPLAHQHRRRRSAGAGACTSTSCQRRRRGLRRQPARPEAVEPEPRLPVATPCRRRRWTRRHAAGAGAGAAAARGAASRRALTLASHR